MLRATDNSSQLRKNRDMQPRKDKFGLFINPPIRTNHHGQLSFFTAL